MAYDDTKVAGNTIFSADWNAFVTAMKLKGTPNEETKAGSDCSGTDGTTGRVLTLANTSTMKIAAFQVFRNGAKIVKADMTVTTTGTNDTITFDNTIIFDADVIEVIYFT